MNDFHASHGKASSLAPRMLIVYRAVGKIIRGWQGMTGRSARHDMGGRSFDDLARKTEAANAG